MKKLRFIPLVCLVLTLTVYSCTTARKAQSLSERQLSATIQLPDENDRRMDEAYSLGEFLSHRDTIVVMDEETGQEVMLMSAIKDVDGEMVAHEELQAAYVTARFRNVAERCGKVDLEYQIVVPEDMQDSHWQLRFHPTMEILDEKVALEDVIITGSDYRKAQLRGYQQYDRFLAKIVSDTTVFIDLTQLEYFVKRNIPELFAFKTDSTFVSDEQFSSVYGVTEQEAVSHFTNKIRVAMNNRRKAMRGRMYQRYVKAPIVTEHIRLDTIIQSGTNFIYNYVQTIETRPMLRKVDIVLSGEIFEQDKRVYTIPPTEPLSFYISSLSSFVDPTERYLKKIIERRVEANTACYIDFALGKADIQPTLSNNWTEIGRIKKNIASLIENKTFDLDSVVVTASASPEGSWKANASLSLKRSHSVSQYFSEYIRSYRDSLEAEAGVNIDMETGLLTKEEVLTSDVPFISRSVPENWTMLDKLVAIDTVLTAKEKMLYAQSASIGDIDTREKSFKSFKHYHYMRQSLYPRLRTVRFDFYLHRKGMVKDTIHTKVIDTTYMNGVQAIRDRDFQRAITLLRPYRDYNTAVAYCAMDYNTSALEILKEVEETAEVNYMLAIIYARLSNETLAVQHYLRSCSQNNSFIHRGNLDPEISRLIKKYDLNKQPDDDFVF